MDEDLAARGKEVRSLLFGGGPANASLEGSPHSKPLIAWTAESVWKVWARSGLEVKYRSLVVCTILASLNRLEQLEIHLLGALRAGWTPEELSEAMLQLTCYAGAAAGADAFAVLVKAVERFEGDKA